MPEPASPEHRAFLRRRSAQGHLDLTVRGLSSKVDEPLRTLAAACRAVAFTEADAARVSELAEVAELLLGMVEEIAALADRAHAATRQDWTPAAADATETEA